jgi:serine phosphatase RsbU (regulator of sigma subunit)
MQNMPMSDKMFFLKRVSIFSHAEDNVLAKIAESTTLREAVPHEVIFHKGDKGDAMYMIVRGEVKVHDGEYTFATLGAEDVFGEYALLDTIERSASVTAIKNTELLVLNRVTFYEVMLNDAEILQGILRVLVDRSRLNNKLQEELNREKEKMAERNQEILAANEEIMQQQEQIELANQLLDEKNQLITSSITYARHIQNALLPELHEFKALLPEAFLLYLPKDIVSGDFYWFSTLGVKENYTRFVVAAMDCTGHGVPGAFMSSLGITYLQQIVDLQNITDVGEILTTLNKNINRALKQGISISRDGMDGTICLIDTQEQTIEVASARSFIFWIEEVPEGVTPTLNIIEGDNFPVGGVSDFPKTFKKHHITYKKGTTFYLFTDGYRDQFGYRNDKKFMMKKFKEMLLQNYTLPMAKQYQILKEAHEDWKGHLTQTDDVLVMGFKL